MFELYAPVKAWSAINRLLIICKFDLYDKIKWDLFQAVAVSILLNECTTWMLTKKARWRLHMKAMNDLEQIQRATPHETQLYSHLPLVSQAIQDTGGETRTNSLVTFFYVPLHMDESV